VIRYLIVLYLGVISVVLIDPNPLWSLPLVIVLIGLMWEIKWVSLIGISIFSMVTVGRIDGVYLTDAVELMMLSAALALPLIVLIDIILAPRPYKIGRFSLVPVIASVGMVAGVMIGLGILVRIQRIGIYLNTDPTLQVFILISLSIFFTGPFLLGLGTGTPSRKGRPGSKS